MELSNFKNKKVLVMGLGLHGGGIGTAKFFSRLGSRVIVTDLKTKKELALSIAKLRRWKNIAYHLGGHRPADFKTADYVIKNPGVPRESTFLAMARRHGVPILSDIGIFFQHIRRPIIGVTGTKGKSTTAALIALMLKARYPRTLLAGNIRKSVLQILDEANRADFVVLELSSFQLEDLAPLRRSPAIALITSLLPDHLNRHKNFADYRRIKRLITAFQTRRDAVVIPKERGLEPLLRRSKAARVLVNVSPQAREGVHRYNPYLTAHFADAALLALAVAERLGVPKEKALRQLRRFRPLEGRLEVAHRLRGITFINDTTATAPAAAAADLAVMGKRRPVVLIAGGADKNLPFGALCRAVERYAKRAVFLPGSATKKILAGLKPAVRRRAFLARSMPEAVRVAYRAAKPGDAILLSPGAASFGLFRHEFDRGEKFVAAVRSLH